MSAEDFAYREGALPPALAPGELLVRNRIFSCAPTIRNWLNPPGRNYRAAIAIGDPVRGLTGAEVIQSRHPRFEAGDHVTAIAPWQDYAVLAPDAAPVPVTKIDRDMPLLDAMSLYSSNTLTAYFGLVAVGKAVAGETVLVSGAAGSVGAVACQIARNLGCRVIGICGGPEKCRWLQQVCGASTVDYKDPAWRQHLAEACAGGVDLFLDNVGGPILDAAVDLLSPHARIAISGQISAYDGGAAAPGPSDMMKIVYRRIRLEGFLVGDFASAYPEAWAVLRGWAMDGKLTVRVDRREGFMQLPTAFVDLFSGRNEGTLLVDISNEQRDAGSPAGTGRDVAG